MKTIALILLGAQLAMAQASKPATDNTTQLRAIIESLRAEVSRLKAENAALKKQIGPVATTKPMAGTTFVDRTKEQMKQGMSASDGRKLIHINVPKDHQKSSLEKAEKIDRAIEKYIAEHQIEGEMADQLRAGKVEIGMPLEALEIYGSSKITSETADGKSVRFTPWSPIIRTQGIQAPSYLLYVSDGKVAEITRP